MDAQAALNLDAAINALAAAAAALPAAPEAPAATAAGPLLPSPYEGDILDLLSHLGAQLFHDSCTPLSSKFMGKVDDLLLFLADLKNQAKMVAGTTFRLLDDYGKLTADQIEAARTARTDS